jgi:F-box and WD-40 domain protein CDC4
MLENVRCEHRNIRLARHHPPDMGHVLIGHQASVRCLEIHGDIVVSGSYDTTAKIWSISEGKCLRTLTGHFSQIYAIAFDGKKIATGSLDTSVRIWDPNDG